MKWEKIGRIFNPEILHSQNLTAALMPIVEVIDIINDIVRVYFSPRSMDGKSKLSFFDIDLKNPLVILQVSKENIFSEGKIGSFDDCGVTPGSFSEIKGQKVFFYTGWSLTKTVPMNNSIGIAIFNENHRKFERIADGPIMTRTLYEPYSCASPFVLKENDKYRMWYASMDYWKEVGGEKIHYYNIKYAESYDGLSWIRKSQIAINYENEMEYAFGRPYVFKEEGIYKMWYSFRGKHYLIGYAESLDGILWKRMDEKAGIGISNFGWDSEMIEYPFILLFKGKKYMFYNGNEYGKTGIGLAILKE
jgi:hypothetical protein